MLIQEILQAERTMQQRPTGLFAEKLREQGLQSSEEAITTVVEARLEAKDLTFFTYKHWHIFLSKMKDTGKTFEDKDAYYVDGGVYSSQKVMEEQECTLPSTFTQMWDEREEVWHIRSLIESTKARDLLQLIESSEARPVDEKLTLTLSAIKQFSHPKTVKLLTMIMDDIVSTTSRSACMEAGVPFNKQSFMALDDVGKRFRNLMDELTSVLEAS